MLHFLVLVPSFTHFPKLDAFEWNKKAIELQPDAFSKNIDLKLDNERNDPSFNWDGLFHSNVNGDSIQKINIIAGLYGKIIEENEESLSKKCEKKLAEMHEESLRQNNLQDQFN